MNPWYDFWKFLNMLIACGVMVMSLFTDVNLLYAVLGMLIAIFLSLEDK